MRTLYLRIYLTVVAALLVFALLAMWLVRQHTEAERGRFEGAVSERTLALSALLANSLPPANTDIDQQRQALLDWSHRLRMPMALDAANGQRLAESPFYTRKVEEYRANEAAVASRVPLADGRTLWVLAMRGGPGGGPDHKHHDGPARPKGWEGWWPRRPQPGWVDDVSVLFGLLGTLFVAVTAGAYPVVRHLTRRLEALQRGVERFGAGELGHRVDGSGRDEVAAVATSFNQAARRIEDLVHSNRALLANASHELRSPLARLKMAVAMMGGADSAQREALRSEIDHDIRELDGLVEEVLLASRLDAQVGLRLEPVDVLGLLVEEAARVGAGAEGDAVVVDAEERLLRRALRNLLENARRYGGDEVDASVRRQGLRQVEILVCDRGPGVPEVHREQVFEPFFRLPGHAERAGGVGLGLALVRQIADRHGGTVRCLARGGGGSCFVITLPCAAAGMPPGAPGRRSG
jgi:signal transduction histidine kinase